MSVFLVALYAMNANAIQTGIAPLTQVGSVGPVSGTSNASSSSPATATFADHLDQALNNGSSSSTPDEKAAKPGQSAARASSPTMLSSAPNHSTNPTTANGAPGAPSSASTSPSANAVSASTQPVSVAATDTTARGRSQTQTGGTTSARLLWLTEMIPFASALQGASSGIGGAQPGAQNAAPSDSAQSANPASQAKDAIQALAGAGNTASHTAAAHETDSAPGQASGQSSSQSSGQSSGASPAASAGTNASLTSPASAATPQVDAQMQRAIRSLENIGVSLASTAASVSGAPLPVAALAKSGPPPATVALNSPIHAPQPKAAVDNPAQTAERDANATSVGSTSSGSGRGDSAAPVKPASASDSSKNGSGQNSQQDKPSNAQQGPGVVEGGVSATAANQAASNGFGLALNQPAQPSGTAAGQAPSSASSSQTNAPQPTVAEKVATAMQNPVNAPGGVVSAASLVENQGKTEMRVALQTDTMGTLQLHAVLDGGRVGASISVVSHEAHTLLTNELPSLQQALADQNVRLDHLTVINTPMASGSGTGDSRGFQSADYHQQREQSAGWLSGNAVSAPAATGREAITHEDIRWRLSVRA